MNLLICLIVVGMLVSTTKIQAASVVTKVAIYHSKNYAKVNKKKAAKRLSVGSQYTVYGMTFKVLKNGKVKFLKSENPDMKIPKYLGVNNYRSNYLFNCVMPANFYLKKHYKKYKGIKYLSVFDEEFYVVIK